MATKQMGVRHAPGLLPMLLALLPTLLAAAAWLVSGRESFTKTQKSVTVQVPNLPYDDLIERSEFISGPICGYFVGLDVVGGVAGVSLFVGIIIVVAKWLRRRNSARSGSA